MSDSRPSLSAQLSHLAPQLDRLVVAGHQAARPHAMRLRTEFGLPGFGVLIDLRTLVLSPGGVTMDMARAIERYVDPDALAAALDRHVEQGLLVDNGFAYVPTARGRTILLALTEAAVQGVSRIWNDVRDTTRALALASLAVEIAAQSASLDRYPAFTAERSGYMPSAPPAVFVLWSHLSAIRYLRADAHALAWREAGLEAQSAVCLTSLCHNSGPHSVTQLTASPGAGSRHAVERALLYLGQKSWARETDDGWEVTVQGRYARDAIEAATNCYSARPFSALKGMELAQLADALALLPAEGT